MPSGARSTLHLLAWLGVGAWRQQRAALIAAVTAVALGVALASGIHLVNRSALTAFSAALATINGQADLRVSAPLGVLDDALLEPIAALAGIRIASPVIETTIRLPRTGTEPSTSLRLLALDPFRAAGINPSLAGPSALALLADDTIALTEAARKTAGVEIGATLWVETSHGRMPLNVIELSGQHSEPLALMDIANAQKLLGLIGEISRIDLRLNSDADRETVRQAVEQLRTGLSTATPDDAAMQMSNLSRAYRVNLNVLALVALLTGAFIVQATMSLTVNRLASTFALLALLGAPARLAPRAMHGLAAVIGIVGAVLGIGLGALLAWGLLAIVGADLGGGYFSSASVALHAEPASLAGFAMLGVAAALAGTWAPARRLVGLSPMRTLRSGLMDPRPNRIHRWALAGGLALVATLLLAMPPVQGLPIAAYISMALGLLAGIMTIAPLVGWLAGRLMNGVGATWRWPAAWLAIARLSEQPASAAIALSGVVASFALVTAMGVMVHSFRTSLDQWLEAVLPADVYVRARVSGEAGAFDDAAQEAMAATDGVARIRFLRTREIQLDSQAAPITLIAREIDTTDPGAALPMTGAWLPASDTPVPCITGYASEPAQIRLGWTLGSSLTLPIGDGPAVCVRIAGIWRDYARQHGALALPIADYRELSGDQTVGDAAITLDDGASPASVIAALRENVGDRVALEARTAGDIRSLSLAIFDRSFALTYALEAIALVVGLFGVVTTYAGEARSRLREFGMLRHLGFTRSRITMQFASEASFAIGIGVALGGALGMALAQILIHWVNPQSFHWRMSTYWPVGWLVTAGGLLVLIGVVGAALATRQASGTAPILAVRADW